MSIRGHRSRVIRLLVALALAAALGASALLALGSGWRGETLHAGFPAARARAADWEAGRAEAQQRAAVTLGLRGRAPIAFGDLGVATGFSSGAPIDEERRHGGVLTVADACDRARLCSALDFVSIADDAGASTPRSWRETLDALRRCDAAGPGLAAFAGWRWRGPEAPDDAIDVVLRDLAPDALPPRPIGGSAPPSSAALPALSPGWPRPLALGALPLLRGRAWSDRLLLLREREAVRPCPIDVPPAAAPRDCRELVSDPARLRARLSFSRTPALLLSSSAEDDLGRLEPADASEPRALALRRRERHAPPGASSLVAVHAATRTRDDVFAALEQGATYATTGARILLWLDLVVPQDAPAVSMGGREQCTSLQYGG